MMRNIKIKTITAEDIPRWIDLAKEHDAYVNDLVSDLTQWYEENGSDIAFADYMKAKIKQNEAFMATDTDNIGCYGVVAFSRKHNRITFFGVAHNQDYYLIGELLMSWALNQLNCNKEITINVIKSTAQQIEKEREFIKKCGFVYISTEWENGVPVDKMMKQPTKVLSLEE